MNIKLLTALTIGAFTVAACGGETAKPAEAPAQAPTQQAEAPAPAAPQAQAPQNAGNPLRDAAALQKAQDSLLALPQFNGKAPAVFQNIDFYNNRIVIHLQDPNKPENVDNYVYDFAAGKWSEPTPVKLSGSGDLSGNITPMSDIRFADLTEKLFPFVEQTAEKEGVTPNMPFDEFASFMLFVPTQERFWQTKVSGDRADLYIQMNLDGTLRKIVK